MPQIHRDWNESRGYDAGWFIDTAQKIGPSTAWAIGQVLVSKFHKPQSYNSFRGILRMAECYGPERLERACKRCHKADKATYSMIKNILHHQLDKIDESPELFSPPEHDNIRGPKAYQ